MKTITIEELAYLMKDAKEQEEPRPIFFLGAGASKSGNIPLAKEIVKDILDRYSDNPFINKLKESERTYSKLLACLQPHQRNVLLKNYIDNAKVNVTHIYLAQLLKNGYVDYILTVNFDNLMLRALSLFNEFPATYDMAILKDLTTTTFKEQSVVYLHGQHHGLWLLNTDDEMKKVKATLPRIFDSIKNKRQWILIGYSGSDPVFEHIKKLGRFDNGLYWVGYKENEPETKVKDFLNSLNINGHYIQGYDSDSFMLKLNESLGLGQPKILDKPFSSLREMIEGINDINEEEHFKGVKERLEIAKKDIERSIKQFEMKESIQIEQNDLDVDKLKKEIIDLLISKSYDLERVKSIEEKTVELEDDGINSLLSGLYNNWGNKLGDLAKTKLGKESEDMYNQAFKKYEKALEIKHDFHEALYNWGNKIGDLAKMKSGKDVEGLYQQAFEKYEKAVEIQPDFHEALFNWGNKLGSLAEIKSGKEAECLYRQVFDKYEKALEIKPDKYETLYNWGNMLGKLLKTKSGKEAEVLYRQVFNKYEKALEIKPDFHEAFYNWGTYLGDLANTKSGKEAEGLYRRSFIKFEKALEIKPDKYEVFYNWGTYLGQLAEIKLGKEFEDIYRQAFEKFAKALKIKPDYQEALYNWGTYLGNLAETKTGKESEDLYREAIDKSKKAIELGASSYNLSCIYAIKQDKENALKYLEKCLSNNEIEVELVLNDEDWKLYLEDADFILLTDKYKH
ncbi:SIR2 family protein [Echinicola sp. CAU 1574]|uniref:SIR2 family protein n=1 Tax=Echinicola arenosa TaxID=2774144 RepID=A0ABR9AGZ4_9BACT|nr:SIR2 family protein [Echinicola arenosa]MBD8488011.1 SIR2 family protein [Echinicola arenosa]